MTFWVGFEDHLLTGIKRHNSLAVFFAYSAKMSLINIDTFDTQIFDQKQRFLQT